MTRHLAPGTGNEAATIGTLAKPWAGLVLADDGTIRDASGQTVTMAEFMTRMQANWTGPAGEPGPAGADGTDGAPGEQGPQGAPGAPGVQPVAVTVTIAPGDWSNKTATKTVSGVTAANHVTVTYAPASYAAYVAAEIRATAQGTDSLTFVCETVPTESITVNVLIIEVSA